ncbi:MAG: deoxyribonuclease IV [Clostridia bacterium]|nr:deoxyribonuclease IV [Clostridia bacterium]MBQ5757555.1 deoxyribonuclease IV [Clostridia bacterium]
MFLIGNHLSSSSGYMAMGRAAQKLGANTFAFFTRNPRGGKAKSIDQEDISALVSFLINQEFGKLVAHAPYTMNLCSDKPDIREFASDMLKDDIRRMEYLPGNYYNLHPGSHVGQGTEAGIRLIADALNDSMFAGMHTTVLLETMSGKGSEIGSSFEELRSILDRIALPERIGVCLDTCHVWDAGYDIARRLDEVLDRFDRIIGLSRLKAVHLNDSMNPCGTKKDRHQKLGLGCIGKDALKAVVRHPSLQGLPFILETPNDDAGYAEEIRTVREWAAE